MIALTLLHADYLLKKSARKRALTKQQLLLQMLKSANQNRIFLLNSLVSAMLVNERRFWRHSRNYYWFVELLGNRHHPDYMERWKSLFRISPSSFDVIVNFVQDTMEREDTMYREANYLNVLRSL